MEQVKKNRFERPLHMLVSFGAAIVIFGALQKILHTQWADLFLKIGLYTEAIIFIVYGILPPDGGGAHVVQAENKPSSDLTLEAMNKMFNEANLTPEVLKTIGDNFKKLNNTIEELQKSTTANQEFQTNIVEMNKNLYSLNSLFEQEIKASSNNFNTVNKNYQLLNDNTNIMISGNNDALKAKEQMALLSNNLSKLNQVYGSMIAAMQSKS